MAAFDAFLKIEGIDGESQDSKLPKHIELLSYSFGATQTGSFSYGGGGGAGKVQFQDFHFNKRCDCASSELYNRCSTGKHIPKAELLVRKAGGEQQVYFKVTFEDIIVSSQTVSGQGAGDPIPQETISFNFSKMTMHYATQDKAGQVGAFVSKYWDLKKNQGG